MSKEVAEKIITESLETAISDFAKDTTISSFSTPRKRRSKKLAFSQQAELPHNFHEVVGVSKNTTSIIEVLPTVSGETQDSRSSNQSQSQSDVPMARRKIPKKHNKLKGFFVSKTDNSKKNVREARTARAKTYKIKRKSVFSGLSLSPIVGVFAGYKKGLVNSMLTLLMFGVVTATTYVTYAYVASRDSDLVAKVGQHVVLPVSDTPKVYIVQSEKADIFQNPAFRGIQIGDNVLTYSKLGKVIIYRSSEDKIVNIVNLQN